MIGARLAVAVNKEMDQDSASIFLWSDSSAVIAWIKREETWSVFVWKRIQEILILTPKEA